MPTMLRISSKATRIAYSILGVPGNMKKRSEKQKKLDRVLTTQETNRAK